MGSLCGVQDSGFEGRVYCLGFRVVFKGVWDWVGFEQRRGFDYRILYGPLIYIYMGPEEIRTVSSIRVPHSSLSF